MSELQVTTVQEHLLTWMWSLARTVPAAAFRRPSQEATRRRCRDCKSPRPVRFLCGLWGGSRSFRRGFWSGSGGFSAFKFGGFVVFGGSASAASGHRGFQTVLEILVQRLPAWLRGCLKFSGMLHGLVCKMFISLNQSSGSQSVPNVS